MRVHQYCADENSEPVKDEVTGTEKAQGVCNCASYHVCLRQLKYKAEMVHT